MVYETVLHPSQKTQTNITSDYQKQTGPSPIISDNQGYTVLLKYLNK